MENSFVRTSLIFGEEAMKKLADSRVAIFGVGGVGGYVVEALVRSGLGQIDLIDDDRVCESNLNRQIIATIDTIGEYKVDIAEKRIHSINPDCIVYKHKCFYTPETSSQFDFKDYDYVVDAIDTVTGKIQLVMQAGECGTPIISSMGAGNKINPYMFEVSDIYKTSVCPLAKVVRQELRKRHVKKLKVVYSKEQPMPPFDDTLAQAKSDVGCLSTQRTGAAKKHVPGSTAFVPSVVGLIIAGEVIKDLTGITNE